MFFLTFFDRFPLKSVLILDFRHFSCYTVIKYGVSEGDSDGKTEMAHHGCNHADPRSDRHNFFMRYFFFCGISAAF